MAVGKQDESTIVHWHPGDTTGTNGLGVSGAAIPGDIETEANTTASGLRTFLDTRITTLKNKVIASGVVATYAG